VKQRFSLEEILNVIKAYIETHGYPPTQRELARKFCCSVSTINICLQEMLEQGILETDHSVGSSRAFRIAGMRVVDTRKLQGAVKQLGDLLNHCRDMAAGKDADPIWGRDAEALEAVIGAVRITEERRKQE
jgi:DNA-binding transcriptional regulator YhcF (GntR family)